MRFPRSNTPGLSQENRPSQRCFLRLWSLDSFIDKPAVLSSFHPTLSNLMRDLLLCAWNRTIVVILRLSYQINLPDSFLTCTFTFYDAICKRSDRALIFTFSQNGTVVASYRFSLINYEPTYKSISRGSAPYSSKI